MHAAVADRVDRASGHRAAGRLAVDILRKIKAVSVASGLGDNEEGQALMGLGPVGIGAGKQCKYVGAGAECAPRLDAVDDPARFAVRTLGAGRHDLDARNVGAVVGLGDCNCRHHFSGCEERQPLLLLLFCAALDERTSEDLGTSNQRAADTQAGY